MTKHVTPERALEAECPLLAYLLGAEPRPATSVKIEWLYDAFIPSAVVTPPSWRAKRARPRAYE